MASPYECADVQAACQDVMHPGGLKQTELAATKAGFSADDIVLDLGCGKGSSLRYLRETMNVEAFGVEPSGGLASHAQPYVAVAQASHLPFGDETLDGVLAECVLSLVEQRDRALSDILRVLRPGGRLVMSDVILKAERDRMLDSAKGCIRGAMPLDHIVNGLQHVGFRVLLAEDHSRLLADFAAHLIFAGVSLTTFFPVECGQHTNAKVGYGLVVAEKSESV
ncbi:DVU_1556 family methyltransferase [Desulfovibrio inopinatus]|uniref:DVU_1556 family methyltransferase n=1 Tax=Desulfovibrio inopinatus TaxID=102109 RepID=UPI00146FAA97|nr:methyltransferase domain-containing protein [Desulfovibrio inopinatus]